MVPTHMPFYCHPLSASVSMAMQGLTSVDIAINNKSVSMVRRLESGAAFVGWLDQKVPKYILGSEWAKRWCVVVSPQKVRASLRGGGCICAGAQACGSSKVVSQKQPVGQAVVRGGELPSETVITLQRICGCICMGPKLMAANWLSCCQHSQNGSRRCAE